MMEYAFRMPGHLKLKDCVTKYIYKKAVEPLIGSKLAYRRKQMFTVPVGEWFRGRLRGYCERHIARLSERYVLFDVNSLRDILTRHLSGSANNTRELRSLIAVDHWL